MEHTLASGAVKDCCLDAANLELIEAESVNGMTVKRCRVCGCRHRRLKADPMTFGVTVKRVPRPAR